jgi:hypothetical protein
MSPSSLRRLRSKCRKMGLGSVAPRQRPKLWWKAPEVRAVLSSEKKYRDMAATLGIGVGALNSIIRQSRQAGLGPARRYQNWWKTPEVQAVLRSGKKYREMAAELGIGMSVLAWIISRSRRAGQGPPRRIKERGKSWDWREPRIRALLESGRPNVEIAAQLGIVRSSARRLRGKLRKESPSAKVQVPPMRKKSAH